jgi:hypothetical protein
MCDSNVVQLMRILMMYVRNEGMHAVIVRSGETLHRVMHL